MTKLDWNILTRAAALLTDGELVAIPTETVYGLAGDATNDLAVAKIYEAKGRPSFNPLIAHVADLEMASQYAEISPLAQTLGRQFWPGPLTLVLPKRTSPMSANEELSLLASAGLDSIALRVPSHPLAQALLKTYARPLVAPSANLSGQISPTTANHVDDGLGDKVAMIIDGGPCTIGVESTVVKITGNKAILLRPGGLTRTTIERFIGQPLAAPTPSLSGPSNLAQATSVKIEAPGMLTSHYAPQARVRLNIETPQADEAYLAFGPSPLTDNCLNLSQDGDLIEAAANFFTMLRSLDKLCTDKKLTGIAVANIPETGLGEAINDRLNRAAAPRER